MVGLESGSVGITEITFIDVLSLDGELDAEELEELLLEGLEEPEFAVELELLVDELLDGLEELGVEEDAGESEQPVKTAQAIADANTTAAIFFRMKSTSLCLLKNNRKLTIDFIIAE